MNDVLIDCFKAATETLNFTTAAQKIHISQPSFSRNIAMLEEELGFSLFWRSKQNGIRLTPAGSAMYKGIVLIEKDYKALLEKSRQISRGEDGKLIIGILNGICMDSQTLLHITRFREEFPQVDVELRSCTMADLENCLIQGTCDICFMMSNMIQNKELLLYENVYSIPTFFVVPKKSGFESGKEYDIEELKEETFLFSEEFLNNEKKIVDSFRDYGFEPKVKIAPDNETKMLWAFMGEGVTGITLDHYIRNSAYVDVIKVRNIPNMDFSICWCKDNYNPAIALFYSLVGEISKVHIDKNN